MHLPLNIKIHVLVPFTDTRQASKGANCADSAPEGYKLVQHGPRLCSTPKWGKDGKVPEPHQHETQIKHLMLQQG